MFASTTPHHPTLLVRRAGVVLVLLALGVLACGDSTGDGERVAADGPERSSDATERRELPPPTPDLRGPESPATPASVEMEPQPAEPPVPRTVRFPEAESIYHAGDYPTAVRYFRAYVDRRPDNPWGRYMLGLSAWKADDLELAETALEAALERDPDHLKSRVNLGRVLLERDRPEDALPHLEKARELAPGAPEVLRVLGNVRSELGETGSALRLYRQAVRRDSTDAWSANNLGLLLVREGRYEDALGPLARATELRPESAVFQNNLGAALERTGHLRLAEQAYRRAADGGHEKAGVSLTRVEGRPEAPGTQEIDLAALADRFLRDLGEAGTEPTRTAEQAPNEDSGKGSPGNSPPDSLETGDGPSTAGTDEEPKPDVTDPGPKDETSAGSPKDTAPREEPAPQDRE